MSKKIFLVSAISMLLSGCSLLTGLWNMMCDLAPESDHCYQFIAVQSASASACENIKWTKFKDSWSNPPRDKCYMQIAQNTWDISVCDKMKGWLMSYEKQECMLNTAVAHNQPLNCSKLKAFPSEYSQCNEKLVNLANVKSYDDKIVNIYKQLEDDPYNKALKAELAKLKKDKLDLYWILPWDKQTEYFTTRKNEILLWIHDEDVKLEIAKKFNDFKVANPNSNIDDRLDVLQNIKDTQGLMKDIDDSANSVYDEVKWALIEMAEEKQNEILDDAKEELIEEAYKRSSESMKWQLSKLERLKNQYDKASEAYQDLEKKYGKLKAAYDWLKDIQAKLWQFDRMLAEWKLDQGKAQVLKWAVLLWKWLEYATAYVPVFWSTISTVSKETFEVVTKFATERAKRTTAIDKCIEDPEHCDPSWITAY